MQNSVLEYLEHTVMAFPDKMALKDESECYSFSELRQKAISLAKSIQNRDIGRHNPIFVYLPKSCRCIISFLGILYSGNCYTPTDVDFPFEKVRSILHELQPVLIITDALHKNVLLENGIKEEKLLLIESVSEIDIDEFQLPAIVDTDPVYILFTSGSTGVPKGVIVSHRSIIDYIDWAAERFQITEQVIMGNQAPFYFDNSILDIYLMLSKGTTMVIIPKDVFAFPMDLMNYVIKENINTIFWVPSILVSVANRNVLENINVSCLKRVLFCGEVMPNKQLNYWRRYLPDVMYCNMYGPTEITDVCTYYIVNREFSDDESLPIGFPCRNTDVLIIDENNHLVTDVNVPGELCVRGSSLALGYWNNPKKTSEVFVQNPLHDRYPETVYRTGDIVYYNEYREIMFQGRKDFQIKHLGYRIELGEIETATLGIEEIKQVCVCYDADQQRIVMFYIADEEISGKAIRLQLMKLLPKYMIPVKYLQVKEFEMTDNGKVARKKMMEKYLLK